MDGAMKQRAGIGWAEVALSLIADLRVDGFALRIADDEFGDLLEGWDRLGSLLGGSLGLDRIEPAGDELPRLDGPVASILERQWDRRRDPCPSERRRPGSEDPFFAPSPAQDEMEAVPVAMPAWLCRLNSPFGKSSDHSPTFSPTLWSGLWHTAADGGRQDIA